MPDILRMLSALLLGPPALARFSASVPLMRERLGQVFRGLEERVGRNGLGLERVTEEKGRRKGLSRGQGKRRRRRECF